MRILTGVSTPAPAGRGSALSWLRPRRTSQPGTTHGRPAAIRIRNLRSGAIQGVSFEANAGDIVGLAGLEGAGGQEVLGALFGLRKADADLAVFPDGSGLPRSQTSAARRGIAMVPADRRRHGLMLQRSVAHNLAEVSVGALRCRSPWVTRRSLGELAGRQIAALGIEPGSPSTQVQNLSGGNQQKVVIAKWLAANPRLLLLDDPTRGVDVGAKQEIYEIIRGLARDGVIVMMTSSEPEELCDLCGRILVFYRGGLAGEFAGGSVTQVALLQAVNTGNLDVTHQTVDLAGRPHQPVGSEQAPDVVATAP